MKNYLAREVKKGLDENARKCKHTGGIPPLGYKVNADMGYEIEPFEADTVRLIFTMYVRRHSYPEIIDELNRQGRTAKVGRTFGKNSLNEILNNIKYTGMYIYNKRYRIPETTRYRPHKRNEEGVIMIKDGMPRIINDDVWREAQDRLGSRKHNPAYKRKTLYLLSGLVYCGGCGQKMKGNRRYDGKNKDRYYISYSCQTSCGGRGIQRDKLEEAVADDMLERFFSLPGATRLAEEVIAHARIAEVSLPDKIAETRRMYMEADKRVMDIVHAVENGLGRQHFFGQQIKQYVS